MPSTARSLTVLIFFHLAFDKKNNKNNNDKNDDNNNNDNINNNTNDNNNDNMIMITVTLVIIKINNCSMGAESCPVSHSFGVLSSCIFNR